MCVCVCVCDLIVEQEWIYGRLTFKILFVFAAVGLSNGDILPHSLWDIFLKDIMFFRNFPNSLNQHFKSALIIRTIAGKCLVLECLYWILPSNTKDWRSDTTTWMNLKNMVLSERSLWQKSIYCLIPFKWSSRTRKTNWWLKKKRSSSCFSVVGARIGVINMFHIWMGFELHVYTFKTQEGIVKICMFHYIMYIQFYLKSMLST